MLSYNQSRRTFISSGLILTGGFFLLGTTIYPSRKKLPQIASFPSQNCVVRPQQTEGPYFRDELLERSDIRSDPSTGKMSEGIPLEIEFNVTKADNNDCIPLEGALVDIWQCDALGIYSDVNDPNFDTRGKKYLRGYQKTNSQGAAKFVTIYPGWYQGRTVHIHFKIRTSPNTDEGYEFTSQIYFNDSISDEVFTYQPYASKGLKRVINENDNIFKSGGESLIMDVTNINGTYKGTFNIALEINPTNMGEKIDIKPDEYNLSQNFPNPFNGSTSIPFRVPASGYLTLKVYNGFGSEVTTLINSNLQPGNYSVDWDAGSMPSGIYYYRLKSKTFTETKKLVLLK